jgi:hypothetical protein
MANETRKREDEAIRIERLRAEDRERFPGLQRYALFDEWTDSHDRWLEAMTGEPEGRRRGSRTPDL